MNGAISTVNKGRLLQFISGINGVSAGGQATLNLAVNQRYHRLVFQCSAVNYTGGTAMATLIFTGSGTGLTITPTVVNGVITAAAVVAGGTGYVTGDTVTIAADATGIGFVGTVTATGGVVSAVAVTVGGTPSAINPKSFFSDVKIQVNGINMRDIAAEDILKIGFANGRYSRRGELAILFSPPWRNQNPQNEVTSWDLFGQSTFQLQFGIKATLTSPGLIGMQEFDYQRNVRPNGNNQNLPFLQPTAQHSFNWPLLAGKNDITTLPFAYPISRIWFQGSTPGKISQVEIFQDGNTPMEATLAQLQQLYGEDNFQLGQPDYINQNWSSVAALKSAYNQPEYYDAAFIADPDGRWWKALKCQAKLTLRVYSDIAQSIKIVEETLPGNFAG